MNKIKNNILKIAFIIVSIIFATPSIAYIIKNKTIYNFSEFYHFFLNDYNIKTQAITFMILLTITTILYYLIIKKQNHIFKNIKQTIIYIAIITVIFMIVLPFTSSDVYYYMGTGRLESKYKQNPYYVSMEEYTNTHQQEIQNDTVIQKGVNYWGEQTIVYGPIWPLICKILTGISMGNVDFCLFLFKLFNVILHIINCYFIYKITKKLKFVVIYGLNPFILLEGIANVHNDMLVITLIFVTIYLLVKKKNLYAAVTTLAISTAIKYFTILLLPFIIIYHFRKKEPLTRLKQCIKYGIIFLIPLTLSYLIYFRDFSVLQGMFTQQNKCAKSIYLVMYMFFKNPEYVFEINKILTYIFILFYAIICINILTTKKVRFINIMKKYNIIIFIFLFGLITNFQPWYIMWLIPTILWQKSTMIKQIIGISILSQFANIVFMVLGEYYGNGVSFVIIMLLGTMLIIQQNDLKTERRKQIE